MLEGLLLVDEDCGVVPLDGVDVLGVAELGAVSVDGVVVLGVVPVDGVDALGVAELGAVSVDGVVVVDGVIVLGPVDGVVPVTGAASVEVLAGGVGVAPGLVTCC